MKINWTEIGGRIRDTRKSRTETLEELGEEMGMSAHHIGRIERGEKHPSLTFLCGFCELTGTSMDYLLTGQEKYSDERGKQAVELIMAIMELLERFG